MAEEDIKIVERPEYADMIINYVQFHRTVFRKPKEWYPELMYNSKLSQPARISTDIQNVGMEMTPAGLIITSKFPLSPENFEIYKKAVNSGKQFKIFVPKDKKLKVMFDQNVKDAISAHNRRVGFKEHKVLDCTGEFISLDIQDGVCIIKVAIRE